MQVSQVQGLLARRPNLLNSVSLITAFSFLITRGLLVIIKKFNVHTLHIMLISEAMHTLLSLNGFACEIISQILILSLFASIQPIVGYLAKFVRSARKPENTSLVDVITVIGASTGGPPIISYILSKLNPNIPSAILIVQHMPPPFTKDFAKRLDEISPLKVKEAEDGDVLLNGHVYVAPGDKHMIVEPKEDTLTVRLVNGPKVHGVKPSIDVTLASLAKYVGSRSIAVILTGLGSDGAQGCSLLKKHGGFVIVQDRRTSTVYGMPKAVIELGVADLILPYYLIPRELERVIRLKFMQRRCM